MKAWLAIILVGGLFIAYLRLIDGTITRPVTTGPRSINYETTRATFYQGETITVKSQTGCKLRAIPAERNFTLRDHVVLPFITEYTNTPPGCIEPGKELRLVELPAFIASGEYDIAGSICYQTNPLRKVCTDIKTNTFTIKPKP